MRTMGCLSSVLLLLPSLHAQWSSSMPRGYGSSVAPIRDVPVTVEYLTTSTQTLPDGTHIVRMMRSVVARDSQGRLSSQNYPMANANLQSDHPLQIVIYDPIQHRMIFLLPDRKSAIVQNVPVSSAGPKALASKTTLAAPTSVAKKSKDQGDCCKALPHKTFNGVEAEGSRRISTTPANTSGNDRALTITSDTYSSPELRMLVYTKTESPTDGERIMEIKRLDRGEPNPELFRMPADYAIDNSASPRTMSVNFSLGMLLYKTSPSGVATRQDIRTVEPALNLPCTVAYLTTNTKTLTDGTYTIQKQKQVIARDAQGRLRVESYDLTHGHNQTDQPSVIDIYDPVAHHLVKMIPSERAAVMQDAPAWMAYRADDPPKPAAVTSTVSGRSSGKADQDKVETLPVKNFCGVEAAGIRETSTAPVATDGNDRPIVSVDERYFSNDLHVLLSEDRSGWGSSRTTAIQSLQRDEPDPGLFEIPNGYTVERLPAVTQ